MKVTYRKLNQSDNTSSLFGIFEGKAAARKTAAEAEAQAKIEAAKQQTLLMQTLAAQFGYNPIATENQAKVDTENAKSRSEIWLYVILGIVVVSVMVGLYFIRKK